MDRFEEGAIMLDELFKKLEFLFPEMVALRRAFHEEPELGYEEVATPAKIAQYLTEVGVDVRIGVGGRGVVGVIRGTRPGKTVALRADFDALPIQEETGLSFASKVSGKMHACGHDGHTATLLVLAKVFMTMKDHLCGSVVLIHQFAEELAPGGAIAMIKDGCLEGVDAIFGTHLWSPLPVGKIGYCYGPFMAAADRFDIQIQGKGGHGAAPHETVDAVVVASSVVLQLQQIMSRNVDPQDAAVLSIASFQAGGAFNVISDTATLSGTVRTFCSNVQTHIVQRMEQIIKGVCEAAGATYTFSYERGHQAVVNDDRETKRFAEVAQTISDPENVEEIKPVMGGEDFAYYLQRVPGTFFFTGAGNEEKGIVYPHHHPKFDFDEDAMLIAAKHLGAVALAFLHDEW